MFNFTTTHIVNSLEGIRVAAPSAQLQISDAKGTLTAIPEYKGSETEGLLVIPGKGQFVGTGIVTDTKDANCLAVKEGYKGVNAKITLDVSDPGFKELTKYIISFKIYLSQGSKDFRYSNDMAYKFKTVIIPFKTPAISENRVDVLSAIRNSVKKAQLNIQGGKLFNVNSAVPSGDFANYPLFTGVDCYQYFDDFKVYEITEENGIEKEILNEGIMSKFKTVRGLEPFGTYEYLTNNIRLNTQDHTSPYGVTSDEMLNPLDIYGQVTIHYKRDRGSMGLHAVGQQATSVTTHVYWVPNTLINAFVKLVGTAAGDANAAVAKYEANYIGKNANLPKPTADGKSVNKGVSTLELEDEDSTEL